MVTGGKENHSAEIFKKNVGDGAIFELARILTSMRTQLSQEKYLTFNPGIILGGTTVKDFPDDIYGTAFGKENVIAKTAIARGDLRFITTEQKRHAQQKMFDIVKRNLVGTTATITFQEGIPAMPPTKNNMSLLKLYSKASNDLGLGVVAALDPGLQGAGDISHVAAIVPANLAGLGPVGYNAHSVKETLEVDTLVTQAQRAALLIYRLIL